jgi:hypothetical protein
MTCEVEYDKQYAEGSLSPAIDANSYSVRVGGRYRISLLGSNTPKNSTVAQILDLFNLQEGWDFGEGEKVSAAAIYKALDIYRFIFIHDLPCEVHPKSDGGVKLIVGAKDVFLDIDINVDLSISLTVEQGFGFSYETLSYEDNISEEKLLFNIKSLSIDKYIKCALPETSISKSIALQKEDLQAKVLETTREEFPFLILSVPQKRQPKGCAPTFNYFIATPSEIQPHFGL